MVELGAFALVWALWFPPTSTQIQTSNFANVWISYIEKFVLESTLRSMDSSIRAMLFHQLRLSRLLLSHREQRAKLEEIQSKITQNSGVLHFDQEFGFVHWDNWDFLSYSVKFEMDMKLSLNLTVNHLFFSTGPLDCEAGNFTISQGTNVELMKFCGYFCHLSIFSRVHTFEAKVILYASVYFLFHSFFSIMQANTFVSFQHNDPTLIYPIQVLHFGNKMCKFQYYLRVDKFSHILISKIACKKCKMDALDGPGPLSSTLTETKNQYLCSTFQCQVYVVAENCANISLKFSSQPLSHTTQVNVSGEGMVILPSSHCLRSPCVVLLCTNDSQEINTTVVSVNNTHHSNLVLTDFLESLSCTFSGLVSVVLSSEGENEESFSLCSSSLFQKSGIHRSFFSRNSSLTLILYWYKCYTEIHVALHVSLTTCQFAVIDPCLFDQYFAGSPMAKRNIHSFNHENNAKLSLIKNNIQVTLAGKSCFVFLFDKPKSNGSFSYPYKLSSHCKIFLVPDPFLPPGTEIFHEMFGSVDLQTSALKLFLPMWDKPLDIKRYFVNILAVHHVKSADSSHYCTGNKEFEFTNFAKSFFVCNSLLCCAKASLYDGFPVQGHFWLQVGLKSPTKINKFSFLIKFVPYTTDWLYFVSRKIVAKCDISESLYSDLQTRYLVQSLLHSGQHRRTLFFAVSEQHDVLLLTVKSPLTETKQKSDWNIFLIIATLKRFFTWDAHRMGISLSWEHTVIRHQIDNNYYISLPMAFERAAIDKSQNSGLHGETLQGTYISDVYNDFVYHKKTVSQTCSTHSQKYSSSHCQNISFGNQHTKHFLVFTDLMSPLLNKSWREADEMCESVGGTLPYFLSRTDLEEVVAFFKLSPHALPSRYIFIGLAMVSTFCLLFTTRYQSKHLVITLHICWLWLTQKKLVLSHSPYNTETLR